MMTNLPSQIATQLIVNRKVRSGGPSGDELLFWMLVISVTLNLLLGACLVSMKMEQKKLSPPTNLKLYSVK